MQILTQYWLTLPFHTTRMVTRCQLLHIATHNPVSNKGELAQLTFMSDEGGDALDFAFTAFRKTILKDPRCIMLDKDFTANHTLAKVFPNSTTLLCLFHRLKWWKSLVNTARAAAMEEVPVDIAKKDAIM